MAVASTSGAAARVVSQVILSFVRCLVATLVMAMNSYAGTSCASVKCSVEIVERMRNRADITMSRVKALKRASGCACLVSADMLWANADYRVGQLMIGG